MIRGYLVYRRLYVCACRSRFENLTSQINTARAYKKMLTGWAMMTFRRSMVKTWQTNLTSTTLLPPRKNLYQLICKNVGGWKNCTCRRFSGIDVNIRYLQRAVPGGMALLYAAETIGDWPFVASYFRDIVSVLPNLILALPAEGSVFHRHSRTVSRWWSKLMRWNDRSFSSFDEYFPFIGESTRKVFKWTSFFGPL